MAGHPASRDEPGARRSLKPPPARCAARTPMTLFARRPGIQAEVAMHANAGRSGEVDFLRGVVLIVIALDHIPASVVSHITLHVYAYCDAAEVFVFLGGYATAAAYCAMAAGGRAAQATRRFLRRAFEIYRAYLLTAAAMLLAGLGMLALRIH